MLNVDIEFTGMAFGSLRKTSPDQPRYDDSAVYLLGGRHQPRLTVGLSYVTNVESDIPYGMRTLVSPAGDLLIELDLSNRYLTLDAVGQQGGVAPGAWTNRPRSGMPNNWADVGYLLHAEYLTAAGVRRVQNADALTSSFVKLDRGTLTAQAPRDPRVRASNWALTNTAGQIRSQALADRAVLHIEHPQNQFEMHVFDKAHRGVGRLVLGPPGNGAGRPTIHVAIFSMCEPRRVNLHRMDDVREYEPLIQGNPALTPPVSATGGVSGDVPECPPIVVIE